MGEVTLRPFYIVKVSGNRKVKQIYIPKDIQDVLGIEVGDYFELRVDEVNKVITLKLLKPKVVEGR